MELVAIAAVAENGVIGSDGEVPWHEPADLRHFRETTTGHPCIMGRTTYEGIVDGLDGPLPDRTSIVLSHERMGVPDDVVNVHGIEAAVDAARETGAAVAYVIGGASVYQQFLDRGLLDRMVLTEVPGRPDGDTYFPDWDGDDWVEAERREEDGLAFVTYVRA